MNTMHPLCFVLMPFGKKPDAAGSIIDFDRVYEDLIVPAVRAADLAVIRADEEQGGGIIHKPMFERLILCEFAVADLTTANANVFYELGVRHATRPHTTVLLFAGGTRLPFDVAPLRAMPYSVGHQGVPVNIDSTRTAVTQRLIQAKEKHDKDSPVYQLVDGFPDIQRLKTDVFRDRVEYAESMKQRLVEARRSGRDAVHSVEEELGNIADQEAAIVVDLFLSYRAVKAWSDMAALVEKMSQPLAATVLVREQLALSLNRQGRGDWAEKILIDLLRTRGPSSETFGILGRVYKDRWEAVAKSGDNIAASGFLRKAIDTYLKGFETDWRDAYPGVNAVTLMEIQEPPDARRIELLPVVRYAVERRITSGSADYWDFASKLELAVLARDRDRAQESLGDALAAVRESWEVETTLRNVRLIREARQKRGEDIRWELKIESGLNGSPGKKN